MPGRDNRQIYKAVKETFIASCLNECVKEWITDDGLDFRITVRGSVKTPNVIPLYINHWLTIDPNDYVLVEVSTGENIVKTFKYNIHDYASEYEYNSEKDSIFVVFHKISDKFKNDYFSTFKECVLNNE